MVTPTRIIRPDLRKLDAIQILLSQQVLDLVEEGILAKAGQLQGALDAHGGCNMLSDSGCKIREAWLVDNYGSVKDAEAQGYRVFDCSEDLHFLHGSLAQLMDMILQIRYLRHNPEARGFHELSDSEAKLLAIQGEMAYRTQQGNVQTGPMARLTPDLLTQLDENREKDQALLGLQDPPVKKRAVRDNPQA